MRMPGPSWIVNRRTSKTAPQIVPLPLIIVILLVILIPAPMPPTLPADRLPRSARPLIVLPAPRRDYDQEQDYDQDGKRELGSPGLLP